jgi:hypothetical protein
VTPVTAGAERGPIVALDRRGGALHRGDVDVHADAKIGLPTRRSPPGGVASPIARQR